jgi:hypothetical protein
MNEPKQAPLGHRQEWTSPSAHLRTNVTRQDLRQVACKLPKQVLAVLRAPELTPIGGALFFQFSNELFGYC